MKNNLRWQLLLFLSLVLMITAVFAAFAHSGALRTAAPQGALTARGETAATATNATETAATATSTAAISTDTAPETATPAETTPTAATPAEATPAEAAPADPAPSAVPSSAAKTENGFTYVISNGQAVIIAADGTVKGDVTVPAALGGAPVGVIGMGAFKDNEEIVSVALPDTVATIDEQAFRGCSALEKLTLGKALTALPESAVADCDRLTEIEISAQNEHFAVDASGVVYNAAHTEIITASNRIEGEYTVPAAVAHVRDGAFSGCGKLTKIIFAGANTVIGKGAFRNCTALTAAVLPGSLKTVPAEAFYGCAALTDAVLPASVEAIGERAFAGCVKLNVSLPGGLKTLGDGAFSDCAALTAIVLPDGCAAIGKGAFTNCVALTSVSLPSGCTAVPEELFMNCIALQNVDRAEAVAEIGTRAFYGCAALEKVGNYTLFTRVGLDAFTGTKWFNEFQGGSLNGKNLLILYKPAVSEKTMTVGANITAIAPGAFRGCSSLEEIVLPSGLLSIGEFAFEGCSALKAIEIPAGVTEIGANAFSGCLSLVTASFDGTARIGANAFTGTAFAALARAEEKDLLLGANLLRASVSYPKSAAPAEARDALRGEPATATQAEPETATATEPVTATATDPEKATGTDGGAATGTDAPSATATDPAPATDTDGGKTSDPGIPEENVYSVRIGVKTIASGAFLGAAGIEKIVLPDGVTILGDGAFAGLDGLKSVNRPATLVYGDAALDAIKEEAACSHANTVLRYGEQTKCAAPWFSGCTYCADCAALLDRGELKAPAGHRFVKTDERGGIVTLTCSVCKVTKTVSAAEYNVGLTEGEAKAEGDYIIIMQGLHAAALLTQCPDGAVILTAENGPVEGAAPLGSGMAVQFPGSRTYTVVLYGDGDGDGEISPADARIALRRSVKLDETLAWRDKACHVINDGSAQVSSEDARLILRASVGLEKAETFGRVTPPQQGQDPATDPAATTTDPGEATETDPDKEPSTDPGTVPGKETASDYKAGYYACVSSEKVRMHPQPKLSASVMDLVDPGEMVSVKEVCCDESSGKKVYWGKISHGGVSGWVMLQYFEAV